MAYTITAVFSLLLCIFSSAKSVYNIPYVITETETQAGTISFGTMVDRDDNNEREFPLPYHYSDEYFAESAYFYNPSLASVSFIVTAASYNSIFNFSAENPYLNKSRNIQELFKAIGISEENYDVSPSYDVPPQNNTVGCIVGHKTIHVKDEDFTLIVVGIRSGGYETEWVGNVFVGEKGDHVGFSLAKNYVMERIKEHVSKLENPGKVKFWVSGYSRGGATANLVGAELDNDPTLGGILDCSGEHIYVYCIEPAVGALITEEIKASDVYANIFSFVNPHDIVPYVAPTEFGFRRYGKDLFLPAPETSSTYAELSARATDLYHSLESSQDDPLLIDNFTMYKIPFLTDESKKKSANSLIPVDKNDNSSQAYFLRRFVPALCSLVGTREDYAKNYELYFMELLYIFMKSPLADVVEAKNQIVNDVIAPTILKAALGKKINSSVIAEKIAEIVNKTLKVAEVVDPILHVVPLAAKLCWHEPNSVVSLINALGTLGHAHFPELALAWLMLMDPQYLGKDAVPLEDCFTQGYYRLLEVSGSVDIQAYNAQANGPVASIVGDTVKSEQFSSPHGIDSNDNKFLSFPADHEYSVTITAREDTTVIVNLQAFSPFTGGCVRNIHYDDIQLKANDNLTIVIPVITEAEMNYNFDADTATKYELKTSKLATVQPTKQLYAHDALDGVFTITATPDDTDHGFVVGAGEQHYGESVLVRAIAYEGYEFSEWVDSDNQIVSTEAVIRVTVNSDIVLSAKFVEAQKSQNILLRHPYIFIGAGVGALVILIAVFTTVCCCLRKCCSRKTTEEQEMTEQTSVDYQTFNPENADQQQMA